jgi:hypothetical protein
VKDVFQNDRENAKSCAQSCETLGGVGTFEKVKKLVGLLSGALVVRLPPCALDVSCA